MSSKVLKYALFGAGIALILCACFAPVDTTAFLENEEIGDLVENGGSGGNTWTPPKATAPTPKLSAESTPKSDFTGEDDFYTVTLSRSTGGTKPTSITFTIANYASAGYTKAEWRYMTIDQKTDDTYATYVVDTAAPPFDAGNKYSISVLGMKGTNSGSAGILITIDP